MSKTRIVTCTDHVDAPTGFGRQHNMLCKALASNPNYEVISLGLWDDRPMHMGDGYLRFPMSDGVKSCTDVLNGRWLEWCRTFKPDVLVTFGDLWMFPAIAEHDHAFRWMHWLPVDAKPYPHQYDGMIQKMDRLVFMSDFGREVYAQGVDGRVRTAMIPHGIDPAIFAPVDAARKARLREEWSHRLRFDLTKAGWVLENHDTNSWRKNTPALLAALALLPKDTVLILHCTETPAPGSDGWDLPDVAQTCFGVRDRIAITGKGPNRCVLPDREVASLIQLSDLHVSAHQGEGFGVGTIEAMACGVPTVITNYTTSQELVGGDGPPRNQGAAIDPENGMLPDSRVPAGLLARVGAWWIQKESPFIRAIVDPVDFAGKVHQLRDDGALYCACANEGMERVRKLYTHEIVGKQWLDLMDREIHGRP